MFSIGDALWVKLEEDSGHANMTLADTVQHPGFPNSNPSKD